MARDRLEARRQQSAGRGDTTPQQAEPQTDRLRDAPWDALTKRRPRRRTAQRMSGRGQPYHYSALQQFPLPPPPGLAADGRLEHQGRI